MTAATLAHGASELTEQPGLGVAPAADSEPGWTSGRLTAAGWMLLVAVAYAGYAQGAFYAEQFRFLTVLLAAVFGCWIVRFRGRVVLAPAVLRGFVALAISTIASSLAAGELLAATPTVAVIAMSSLAVAVAAAEPRRGRKILAMGVVACGVSAAATAWAGVVFHREPWACNCSGIWRGASAITYANGLSALLTMALMLCLARLVMRPSKSGAVVSGLLAVGIVTTMSRAGVVSAVGGVLLLGSWLGWRLVARRIAALAPGVFVAVAALVPGVLVGSEERPGLAIGGLVLGLALCAALIRVPALVIGALIAISLSLLVFTAGRDTGLPQPLAGRFSVNDQYRAAEWRAAAAEFGERPLLGQGPGQAQFSWIAADDRQLTAHFAHNEYLELLATHGLAGGAALLVVVGAVLHGARKRWIGPPTWLQAGAAAGGVTFLAHSGFDFLWHIPALLLCVAVLAGLVLGVDESSTAAHGERSVTRD